MHHFMFIAQTIIIKPIVYSIVLRKLNFYESILMIIFYYAYVSHKVVWILKDRKIIKQRIDIYYDIAKNDTSNETRCMSKKKETTEKGKVIFIYQHGRY